MAKCDLCGCEGETAIQEMVCLHANKDGTYPKVRCCVDEAACAANQSAAAERVFGPLVNEPPKPRRSSRRFRFREESAEL